MSYLLFHTVAEFFSIVIAFNVFLFGWNTRRLTKNNFLVFISIAFLFVGIVDFVHALTYKGMNIFPGVSTNVPTQLWLLARYFLVGSFLTAPLVLKKKISPNLLLGIFGIIVFTAIYLIFNTSFFPDAYIDGIGLTPFKIWSEYIIALAFGLLLYFQWKLRAKFDHKVANYIFHSLVANIIAGLLFTLYKADVYSVFNAAGHIVKIIAYYFIYKAIIETGLQTPFRLLFLELNRLNKTKDDFLGIVSHELKTPLTGIKTYAGLLERLLEKPPNKSLAEYTKKINEQADRISKLVNDLVDTTQIETGKVSFKPDVIVAHKFLEQIIEDIAKVTGRKIVLIGKDRTLVKADKDRLRQVLLNLINNALKYSPAKNPVEVSIENSADIVSIAIKDYGQGIDRKDLARLFDKYFQVDKGKNHNGGMGLGLYLSKQIIELHKGTISVQSKKGEGSIFTITLPQARKVRTIR